MKQSTLIGVIVVLLIIIAVGVFMFQRAGNRVEVVTKESEVTTQDTNREEAETEQQDTEVVEEEDKTETVIGKSANGHGITAYHYGSGDTELLFVGGIHGGYEWNTALVAYELMDYLKENPEAIPEDIKVTVIPVLNPDGLNEIIGTTGKFSTADAPGTIEESIPGRFNGNNVDLNRNFDCEWQSQGTWQNRTVSGGDEPFSEPESQAIRDYVEENDPAAAVVFYSAAGGVYSSNCGNGVSAGTLALTNTYAEASGYSAHEEFDFYKITGDMVNWLAKNDIPAISVLLTTHSDIEWEKNKKGIDAVLASFSE